MGRIFQTAGESLLQRLVPTISAGACVPEQGQVCCGCCYVNGVHHCFRINCTGQCVAVSKVCC